MAAMAASSAPSSMYGTCGRPCGSVSSSRLLSAGASVAARPAAANRKHTQAQRAATEPAPETDVRCTTPLLDLSPYGVYEVSRGWKGCSGCSRARSLPRFLRPRLLGWLAALHGCSACR